MDQGFILFGVLLFVAVVLALEGLYHLWTTHHSAEAKRIAARLRMLDGAPPQAPMSLERLDPAQQQGWLHDSLLGQLQPVQQLHDWVRTSGTGRTLGQVLLASAMLCLAGILLALLQGAGGLVALACAPTLAALPWIWVVQRRAKRIERLQQQLPLALDLIGRALRAGHTLSSALKMAGDEVSDPLGCEFRQLCDEVNFGMSMSEALPRLSQRVPLADMRYLAVAVMIQREAGGNLTELLDSLAALVRSRFKLCGQVRTYSAEGKLSAWILGLMPFVVAGFMQLTNPEFLATLWTDPTGRKLASSALVMMAVGALWMRQIIRIRV
jgi:tight adherence protein B